MERKPDDEFVNRQMCRLDALCFAPKEAASLREVKIALRSAKDNHEVKDIVTDWIRSEREYPKPADIYDLLYARRIADGDATAPLGKIGCHDCGGSGFRIAKNGQYEGAAPCECRKLQEVKS